VLAKTQMDVTGTVDLANPAAVSNTIQSLMAARYPGIDTALINRLVGDIVNLYNGNWDSYEACDVGYHNLQHVLDVTLAMARLLDGHDASVAPEQQLGPQLALTGLACALLHDSGYLRRRGEPGPDNGGAFTKIHVGRSAEVISLYLPGVGLGDCVPVCRRIVHFTSYEVNPQLIPVADPRERRLGELLGSADLLAQMADRDYLPKCRDHLYPELEHGGMAGPNGYQTNTGTIYKSPQHLLESTPGFMDNAIDVRLKQYFNNVYQCLEVHFQGSNPYMDAVRGNLSRLQGLIAQGPEALASL